MTDNFKARRDGENDDTNKEPEANRLRYQDRAFFGLIESIPDVILATDVEGDVRYASASVQGVLGYAPHQVVRRSLFDFVHPDEVGASRKSFKKIVAKTGATGELNIRVRHRHVGWRDMEAVVKRLPEGDTVVVSLRDITGRKATEQSARLSEDKLRLYFEQTRLGIIEWDADLRVAAWNKAAEKIFGYSAKEVLGRDVGFLIPDEIKDFGAHAGVWAMGNWDAGPVTNENVTQDGRLVLCDWCNTKITDAEGKAIAVISLVEDVTEKKRVEQKVAQAQRLEMIGSMASGLANDLNNVLSPLMMLSQALRENVSGSVGEARLEILDTCARRGLDLVRHILSLARGTKMERTRVNCSTIFNEILSVVREVFPKNVQIKTMVPSDLWLINGNAVELHQVLINLCLNARDAMPDGGLLALKAKNTILSRSEAGAIPNATAGPYVEWNISDTGCGIATEDSQHIFDPFFTTKEHSKGSGLGLAVSMRIVQSHGGAVRVVSDVGKGTTFKIYFPAIQRQTEPKRSEN